MQNLAILALLSLFISPALMSAEINRFNELFREELREIRNFISHGLPPEEDSQSVLAVNSLHHARDWVEPTPSQPQGPFYPIRLPGEVDTDLTIVGNGPRAQGVVVLIQGQVMDQFGNAINNATIEIWQACASGRYNHPDDGNLRPIDPNFQDYATTLSDITGKYIFKTIVPGPYPASENWTRPPHIHMLIKAPGYSQKITQLYFDGDSFPEAITQIDGLDVTGREINAYNEVDLLLSRVPSSQRHRLIVQFREVEVDHQIIKLGVFNIYLRRS